MKYELFDYQSDAAAAVLRYLRRAAEDYAEPPSELSAVVLAAPTGAGKTVIATAVVEAALESGTGDATFLWVTDDPSLNRQTLKRMVDASSSLSLNQLTTIESDFDEDVLPAGQVLFLNIQKLSQTGTLSRSKTDGRTYSLWETIANTVERRPGGFVVVVDEAHRGLTTASRTRETIVSQIIGGGSTNRPPVPVVWGISATPGRFREAMAVLGRTVRSHPVLVEDVRESGLLKDQIVLGHTRGVDAAESTLVRHAVRRVREYDEKWAEYTHVASEVPVHPALVIQVADKTAPREIGVLMETVFEEWPDLSVTNVVHTFAEHTPIDAGPHRIDWCPPEDIQDRGEVRIVLCKTAITTGWDCPRAEVLLSLRVAQDIDAITQVMGRMVRAPLARRVSDFEDLNAVHCILPKFNQDAVDVIAERFKAGDDELLARGTAVVLQPVALTLNTRLGATLQGAVQDSQRVVALQVSSRGPEEPDTEFLLHPNSPSVVNGTTTSPASQPPVRTPADRIPEPRSSDLEVENLFSAQPPLHHFEADHEDSAFGLVESLPSYTIPSRNPRPPIERLFALAIQLADEHGGKAIEALAPKLARNALFAVINNRRDDLRVSGELDTLLEQAASTRLFERAVKYGQPGAAVAETDTVIELDMRGIGILMERARKVLPQGLANDYVNHLAGDDADAVPEAIRVTIAMASDPQLPQKIENRAADLVEEWFQRYGAAITHLPASEQARFDRIKQQSERPLRTTIVLPRRQTGEARGPAWEKHLLAGGDGLYRADFAEWEERVLTTELNAGVVAWYRNPARGKRGLQIPYEVSGWWSGLAPDFIFVNLVGDELAASIIDPHGTHLADAAPKLKGIAAYAEEHANRFHRIQSVARIDGSYLMLNHLKDDVRAAIKGFNGTDAADLFRRHGIDY